MRKLRIGLVGVGAFVLMGLTAPTPTIAQVPVGKVVICHTPGHRNDALNLRGQCGFQEQGPAAPSNNKVIEIEVSENACKAHLGGPCLLGT
jgi:hypothetical protein